MFLSERQAVRGPFFRGCGSRRSLALTDRERVPFPELLSVKDEGSLLSRQLWAGSERRQNHLLPPRAHCGPLRLTVQLDFLGGAISVLKLLFLSFYLLVKKKLLSALEKSLRKTFRDCGFQ